MLLYEKRKENPHPPCTCPVTDVAEPGIRAMSGGF